MLWRERIESLKAGLLGAIASGSTAFFSQILLNRRNLWSGIPSALESSIELSLMPFSLGWIFRLFVALLSGFLFGVTYRYIVRQDESSHLRSGAVLAFALVRGLAQLDQRGVDQGWLEKIMQWRSLGFDPAFQADLLHELWLATLLLTESWLLFGFARLLLDLSLSRGWLRTFS